VTSRAASDDRIGWLAFGTGALAALADRRAGTGSEALADLRERFEGGARQESTFAVIAANARLPLDDAEVLAVLAAAEFEPSQHLLVADIQGHAAKNRLTLGTLVDLFSSVEGHRGVLSVAADAPLRVSGLVDVVPDGPWSDHIVALHPSVLWALVGDLSPDPDLPRLRGVVSAPDAGGELLTVVTGVDRQRRIDAAAEWTAGERFLLVSAPAERASWTALVREATLTGTGVIVEVDDGLPAVGARWIEQAQHIPWSLSSRIDLAIEELPDRPWRSVTATDEPPSDREWSEAFGETDRTHPLKPEQLERVGRAFDAVGGDLDAAVRRLVSGRLDNLARRIRPSRDWHELVLSSDRKAMLRGLVDRYQYADRVYDDWAFATGPTSRGIVALFSGPSGTGKTMAAEVIAGELGLDVFKLDLSSVVSKYIGETEKNLEQVFDAASAGNLVLFFDEADALFGKRSEVKDARDRYANIEVSYLLQRLEAYEGLVIMATNFEKNVDDAFLRRIHVRIEFELPGAAERAAIWQQNLPGDAPVGEVDVGWLADRFEISGGNIQNAAVHAAFGAAAAGTSITTKDAVMGVATEFRKLGRLIRPDDFGEHYDLVATLEHHDDGAR
jgi:hypothetical protein